MWPVVLNAFRHHRGGHPTADGVRSGSTARAQRLSASQRWASRPGCSCMTSLMCSTPFGITEVGIGIRTLRHRPASCAQRLSASQRWASIDTRALMSRLVDVLNAFRHHRGGHRELGCDRASRRCVLNAFRHHRGGHDRPLGAGACQVNECSTPFGITEVGMSELRAAWTARCWCSTPFGITEVGITHMPSSVVAARLGAQRLSASQRWASSRALVPCEQANSVLNAFRHHRGGHRGR